MNNEVQEFSLKRIFFPLPTSKAIHYIVLVGILVYANSLMNGFVWDDLTYIVLNPGIHTFNIFYLFKNNLFNSTGYYRPIPAVYFSLLYTIFGTQAFFYHLFELFIHILNTCLLFSFFRKFFRQTTSFVLSIIFLIHPIQVESVSYISAGQSELFFLFGISALLFCTNKRVSVKQYFFIAFLLLLSLLTKETGSVFLVLVLFYLSFIKKKKILTVLPYLIGSALCYAFIRFIYAGVYLEKNRIIPIGHLPLLLRMINIPEIIFYYITILFYPAKLSIDQLWIIPSMNFYYFYLPLLIDIVFFILLSLFVFYLYKRKELFFQTYIFFFAWFAMGIIMLLQLYPLDMTVADRWFYFPLAGLLGMCGVGYELICSRRPRFKPYFYIVIVIVITAFSVRTMIRNANWYDPITLYTHDSKNQDNFDIENSLGVAYSDDGNYKQAVIQFKKSVALYPNEINLDNLAEMYGFLGNTRLASQYFAKALVNESFFNNNQSEHELLTYVNLVWFLLRDGSSPAAEKIIQNGLHIYPNSAQLWEEQAIYAYRLHNKMTALSAIKKAIMLSPIPDFSLVLQKIQLNQPINLGVFPSN